MIVCVTQENIFQAAAVHAESWRASHGFCTPEFVAAHTTLRQAEYLRGEMEQGKELFMLVEDVPIGVVSVWGSVIENLYILPSFQRQGHGTRLLAWAESRCEAAPTLWILSNNNGARHFYLQNGYDFTGERKELSPGLAQLEMRKPSV